MTPAVGYVRVSSDEQVNGFGLAIQRDRIADYCKREGLKLVGVHEDAGISGRTQLIDRPGLSAALADIEDGRASVLIVARQDRLARDTLTALTIEEQAFGGRILYVEGSNGDEPEQVFAREMFHSMAKMQRTLLVRRLHEGKRRKKEAGGYVGGKVPLGYVLGRDGALQIEPEAAEVVRWIFRRAATDGWTVRKIAYELNAAGTLGHVWHPSYVQRILRRRLYTTGPKGSRIVDGKIANHAAAILTRRRRA